MKRKKTTATGASLLTIIVVVVIALLRGFDDSSIAPATEPSSPTSVITETRTGEIGESSILGLFRDERSDAMVEIHARVSRLLPDDNEGSRHQRFIVQFEQSDHTVLIAHNIDLAERVPVEIGDWVRVAGEYEWSGPGGVIHWTHHNPNPNPIHPGGWIEHKGVRYE